VLVHKIAGAAAEQGKDLAEVKRVAEKVIANVRSIGFALTSCTTPAKGSPTFELEEDKMEYGVGIHGEPGVRREALLDSGTLAANAVGALCGDMALGEGEKVALLVNGFGGTPLMELYLLHHDVMKELSARGLAVYRSLVGNYMTSIDMAGASVTLLRLDDELAALLDEPADTPGLCVAGPVPAVMYEAPWSPEEEDADGSCEFAGSDGAARSDKAGGAAEAGGAVWSAGSGVISGDKVTLENMIYIIDVMSGSVIRNETAFCELDAHAGDGDFGMSIAKGFRQLKREWKSILSQEGLDIGGFLDRCSLVIMEHCGGASGPIWGSAFRAAAKQAMGKSSLTVSEFAELLQAAVRGIQSIGERSFGRGAVVGDKTLIDALVPCADAWSVCAAESASMLDAFRAGAEAAIMGAKETEKIVARMGRAGNVGERSIGYPDAGAHALGVIFTDFTASLVS
jgi:dihydroxyacetone kinase